MVYLVKPGTLGASGQKMSMSELGEQAGTEDHEFDLVLRDLGVLVSRGTPVTLERLQRIQAVIAQILGAEHIRQLDFSNGYVPPGGF